MVALFPQAAPLCGLPAVKHGLPSSMALLRHTINAFPNFCAFCERFASGFLSNSFLGEIPDLLGLQPLHGCGIVGSFCQSPCSRHRFARRQHEAIEDVTARAVNIAGSQVIIYIARKAPKVLHYA